MIMNLYKDMCDLKGACNLFLMDLALLKKMGHDTKRVLFRFFRMLLKIVTNRHLQAQLDCLRIGLIIKSKEVGELSLVYDLRLK